jgi:hypothetical protein
MLELVIRCNIEQPACIALPQLGPVYASQLSPCSASAQQFLQTLLYQPAEPCCPPPQCRTFTRYTWSPLHDLDSATSPKYSLVQAAGFPQLGPVNADQLSPCS